MIRLFAGLSLPDPIADLLLAKQCGLADMRWQPKHNLHITLRFMGDMPEDRAEDLDAALLGIQGDMFDLHLDGFDYFGDGKKGRLLYARVAPDPALTHLQEKVVQAARHVGIDLAHERYIPHVTLARFRKIPVAPIEDWIADQGIWKSPSFTVSQFHLYSSHLGQHGSQYQIEADYPLNP